MADSTHILPTPAARQTYIVQPQKFALWSFVMTVIMIFVSLSSAFVVYRGAVPADKRLLFDLPQVLWYNLALVVFSSIPMIFATRAAHRGQQTYALLGLAMTLVLGVLFLLGQVQAFGELTASGLPMVDQRRTDNSVAYFYLMAGLHGVHIVSGLLVLLVVGIETLVKRYTPVRQALVYDMAGIFWHFLGLLWVYLFFFLRVTL
ncbi:MAG: cytochrome c oxidase subunit 3 [Bacteroidia bacterium]